MGAVTISVGEQTVFGNKRVTRCTLTMSSSYSTGGDTVSVSGLGLSNLDLIIHDYQRLGIVFEYDYAANTIIARYPTGGATAAPTSVSAVPITTTGASTASAVDATTPNLTPGVGKQVGATANLSTVVLRAIAFGS